MKLKITLLFLIFLWLSTFSQAQTGKIEDPRFIAFQMDFRKYDLKLYWKDETGKNFRSIQNLKNWLGAQGKILVFAMNAGMYQEDGSPLGLFIEHRKMKSSLNIRSGAGNFYLKPNGVFFITVTNATGISITPNFKQAKDISYATQSGPMLVIDGRIHSDFKKGSANLNIRNGVGVLPDGTAVFAMSKNPINFYDFAEWFMSIGCKNALYLDGFVSRTYHPEKRWMQTDGDFGVIIGVTKK